MADVTNSPQSSSMKEGKSATLRAYGFPIAGIVAVTLLRLPLEPFLHGRAPYGLYYIPILLAAWYGGIGPTLVAILLSLGAAWFFVIPKDEVGYPASLGVYLVVSGTIALLARVAYARHESRAFLAAVVESSDDAIVTKDLFGTIRSWNPGAERIFGYKAHEIVGRPITTILTPEHHDQEATILQRIRRGERIAHFETVRVAKDGRRVDVSVTISPVRNPSGEIIGASNVTRDVSDRKRAEEELAAERERLARTLHSIGDAVISTDAQGRVVFLNPVAERLTGWRTSDAAGHDCGEIFRIVNEATRAPVESPVTRVLRLGTVVGLANSTILVAKDGKECPIDDSGAPILGADGALRGVVLVFRDVSERRLVDAERQEASTEREQLLERERAARIDAEQANRSKDEFVAMVSHELRTPLNAIMGWTQILKRAPEDLERVRQGIDVIERNTRSQEQLVADLLDMSRIISGKLRLDVQDVDLGNVISAAIETTRHAAEAKRIAIDCTVDSTVVETTGDPNRLQQCVWNLLSNAIKFTPQGGRVSVRVQRADSHVEIAVADNGIGIRPDFLPVVFERFRQARTDTGKRSGGLGLGLAIVKQLIELHGGRVYVESAGPGQGSTFILSLPIRAVRSHAVTKGADAESPVKLDGIKVLVVEDDPDNREALRTLLEQHHAAVYATASAREALELLPSVHPNIIVSDIGLPEVDGYELIRGIRRLEPAAGGRVPAIALTAHATSDDRTRALRAGYQAHVAKPVDPGELVANIASLARVLEGGIEPGDE